MHMCSFCCLPTDPLPYHSWAVHCLDALKAARAQDAAKLAAFDLLAEHYEALECEVDRLAGELAGRDAQITALTARCDYWRAEAVRLAQREATVEAGG